MFGDYMHEILRLLTTAFPVKINNMEGADWRRITGRFKIVIVKLRYFVPFFLTRRAGYYVKWMRKKAALFAKDKIRSTRDACGRVRQFRCTTVVWTGKMYSFILNIVYCIFYQLWLSEFMYRYIVVCVHVYIFVHVFMCMYHVRPPGGALFIAY